MTTKIHLDKRLFAIAEMVPSCPLMADIGTDHGYLPCYLIQKKIVEKAIARDIAIMPLKRAESNIQKYHLENQIITQQASGLQDLNPSTNCVVIAGMGGHLIANILQNSKIQYPVIILQPNANAEKVRQALMNLNYKIVDETIVLEEKKFYEIIKAIPGYSSLTEKEILYGPINLKKKENTFFQKYQKRLTLLLRVMKNVDSTSPSYATIKLEIDTLQNILKKE